MESNYANITRADIHYITVADFIKALEKNGYEHTRGYYVNKTRKKFLGIFKRDNYQACAMGQAGLNLNAYPVYLTEALDKYAGGAGTRIIVMNDSERLPYHEIVAKAKEFLRPYSYKTLPIIRKQGGTGWTPVVDLNGVNIVELIHRGEL